MTALRRVFDKTRAEGRAALVPFLVAGDPDLDSTVEYAAALVEGGADVLELGVPFSDPLADGPVIQRATERALAEGVTTTDVLACAARIRDRTGVPIVIMSYLNPLLTYGWERFVTDATAAGVVGAILTDVPPEEAAPFLPAAAVGGLGTVFLVAPTSGEARILEAARVTTGFLYCVSRLGVTGARQDLSDAFRPVLEAVRRVSDIPIGVGFGISTPDHARRAAELADGVIIGSRLVAALEAAPDRATAVTTLRDQARAFRKAMDEVRRA
ncbi:MAG: tryptophan synthase alpha chain [Gemmatimonadota bacterium]|nr:MAG: tryptophan synthase alpha chain [Gemmatimonadota bacterium]